MYKLTSDAGSKEIDGGVVLIINCDAEQEVGASKHVFVQRILPSPNLLVCLRM